MRRSRAGPLASRCTDSGSASIALTRLRGSSEETGSWNTIWICLRKARSWARGNSKIGSPRKITWPPVGSYRRRMVRPAVDLPQPDSPTKPRVSPCFSEKEMPSTAFMLPTTRRGKPPITGKYLTRSITSSRAPEPADSGSTDAAAEWSSRGVGGRSCAALLIG